MSEGQASDIHLVSRERFEGLAGRVVALEHVLAGELEEHLAVENQELLTWLQQMHGYQQGMNAKLDELKSMHAELPEHLRATWPLYEYSYSSRWPGIDPATVFGLHVLVQPTGLRLRLMVNANRIVWEREVFFAER